MSRSQSGEEKDNRLLFGVDVRYCSPNPTWWRFFQPIRSRIKNSRWRRPLGNSVQQRNLVAVVMAVAMAVLMVVLIGVVVPGVVTGPLHLLSENGDLSFLLFFFSKQCLVENFQGKFQRNSSATFISEESP